MYLTRLFLGGLPESVNANYGYVTGRGVEDNAVAVLRYANGALGIVEAGFVNNHSPFTIEVHGTHGSLLYGTPDSTLLVRSPAYANGEKWTEVTVPEPLPSAFQQWVTHIQEGTRSTEIVELGVDLTLLMEAANHSVAVDAPVRLQ
jgi:1,5-anhydro-D-fructose reductase (1,5-anhydro-D-mannitol-forming)